MAKAFQRSAFQNDTDHSNKAFQVEGGAVAVVTPPPVMYAMRAINPDYRDMNPGYRGISIEPIGRSVQYDGKGVDYRAR